MTRIELELPDEVASAARARATEVGFASVEAYASALMQAEFADPDAELERLLVTRLSDTRPKIEATPEFWNDLGARVRSQIGGSAKVTP
jgi:hypothetical protein